MCPRTYYKLLFHVEPEISERSNDSLESSEHWAESKVDQHGEEQDAPERSSGHVDHRFGESDEGETGTRYSLVVVVVVVVADEV